MVQLEACTDKRVLTPLYFSVGRLVRPANQRDTVQLEGGTHVFLDNIPLRSRRAI